MYICLNRGTTGGQLPQETFARLAGGAGFPGCDVDLAYAQKHGIAALGDLFASLDLRFGGWGPALDHRTTPADRAEASSAMAVQAAIAEKLKIDSCATWIMPSSDASFMETWKMHVDGLRPVAQILGEHGLRLGLEFVSPYHLRRKHPNEFISTPGLMLELAHEIGPNVGLLIDSFHCHCSQTPWQQIADLPPQKIVLAHLNDAPNLPPEQLQDSERLLPGDGALDLPAYLNALSSAKYDGPLSLEAFGCVKDLPPTEAARKAWKACRNLITDPAPH
jgi:sugar phosphate isomerase/epimerase